MESSSPLIPATHRGRSRLVDYGFFAALLLAAFLFYRTVRAVLVPVVLGAFLAVLARPFFEHICRRIHNRRVAAALATIGVLLLVIVPTALLIWAVINEVAATASVIAGRLSEDGVAGALDQIPFVQDLRREFHIEYSQLKEFADGLVARSTDLIQGIVAMASALLAGAFILIISLYYFLIDGPRWRHDIERVAPIEPRYVRAFSREFVNVSHALFYGSVVTAVVQGFVSWLGYMIFGVPSPILWGAVTAVMSITPIVGTAVVWAPIGIVLIASGSPVRGVLVMVWGMLVTGSIDNVVRPLLMKGRMRLHPLLVFLAIIGGVGAFGMFGIFAGPLAAALFLTAIRIYDRDYRDRLLADDDDIPKTPSTIIRP